MIEAIDGHDPRANRIREDIGYRPCSRGELARVTSARVGRAAATALGAEQPAASHAPGWEVDIHKGNPASQIREYLAQTPGWEKAQRPPASLPPEPSLANTPFEQR